MTKHLDSMFRNIVEHVKTLHTIAEHDFWIYLFREFRQNRLIKNLMKANLIEKLLQCHQKYTYEICQEYFRWDITVPRNALLVHYQMGGIIGLMNYATENDSNISENEIADFLEAITTQLQQQI